MSAALLEHLHDVLADAVASAEHHSHFSAERLSANLHVVRLGALQLEQLVHHVCVLAIGELHVALLATHHEDRLFGQIGAHHATVVGSAEVGILERFLVSLGNELAVERLRSLSATQTRTVGDVSDEVAVHLDDRIGRRHGYVHGAVGVERLHDVVDDALADERTYGVVEDEVGVLVLIGGDGRERRVVALGSALQYLLHLAPLVAQHDILEVGNERRIRHNGYLVDVLVALEHVDGVLHDHLACHLKELFRCGHTKA